MKRARFWFAITAVAVFLGSVILPGAAVKHADLTLYVSSAQPLSQQEESLYDATVTRLLQEDLWTPRDMYDTASYLMVPMHFAFQSKDAAAVKAFGAFFSRFITDVTTGDTYQFSQQGYLDRLQFLYLTTQFMNLCASFGYEGLIPAGLSAFAQNCAETYLYRESANWGTEASVLTHIQQVIAGKTYALSYYSAIDDLELFTLAILCDLHCLRILQGEQPAASMTQASQLAYQLFSSPALNKETSCGGWLFEVGVWAEYPDYAYAGNQTVTENIQPLPKADMTWDTSHFSRMPLFLNSYESAQEKSGQRELFVLRKKQLSNQLADCVMQKMDGKWLLTTFMDGTNGVYRYSYHVQGVGLEGYDLSGTFLLGWWSLLKDSRVTKRYQEILQTFPMQGDRSNPYFDFATVREQNPFFDMDTAFNNGMFACIVTCASKIS